MESKLKKILDLVGHRFRVRHENSNILTKGEYRPKC